MFWVWSGFVNRYQSLRDDPRFICYDGICFNLAMLPLLNYQSYKITFTIMISLLSIPFPEWFFCSNSKIRNKKNRKKKLQNFQKKSMSWSGIRSGPVRSTGSGVPIRSGPVRFRKSRSGRLLCGIAQFTVFNNLLFSAHFVIFRIFPHNLAFST